MRHWLGTRVVSALTALLAFGPLAAHAQDPNAPTDMDAPLPSAPLPAPKAGDSVAPKGVAGGRRHGDAKIGDAPRVVTTGFETLADGSTRLYVELSKTTPYETKTLRHKIAYVLKGARVVRRNNTNPLVTLHFNTPITSARLVPHGRDLWLVVVLRRDVSVEPTVTSDATKDGGSILRIAFPKGDYLPKGKSTARARTPRDGIRRHAAP